MLLLPSFFKNSLGSDAACNKKKTLLSLIASILLRISWVWKGRVVTNRSYMEKYKVIYYNTFVHYLLELPRSSTPSEAA